MRVRRVEVEEIVGVEETELEWFAKMSRFGVLSGQVFEARVRFRCEA